MTRMISGSHLDVNEIFVVILDWWDYKIGPTTLYQNVGN